MDDRQFDALAKRLRGGATRRVVLGGLASGLAGGVVRMLEATGLAQSEATPARHRHRRRCPKRKTRCGRRCVNLERNEKHCGACGNRCDAGETCLAGGCSECRGNADCQAPQGGSVACVNGRCVVACPADRPTVCGAAPGVCQACCANVDCDPGETCVGGVCCANARACGTNANPICCGAGETCVDGQCQPACRRPQQCGTVANPTCCAADETCVGADCCPNARVCGTGANPVCCGPNQSCDGTTCQTNPQTLSEQGSGTATTTSPDGCQFTQAGCTDELSGAITSGTPIAAGTFSGTLSGTNYQETAPPTFTADVSGAVTLTETATGDTLTMDIANGTLTGNDTTGAFSFTGTYTITGGTGRFAGATGTGTASGSGVDNGATSTLDTVTLEGTIVFA